MKIHLNAADDVVWARIGDISKNLAVITPGEAASDICHHERGAEDKPQLMEIAYVPDAWIAPHHHDSPEILYIAEGEMHFGDRVLGPGSSIFIDGNTVYSYRAGPTGLRVLNFRPHADFSFHPKG